MTPEQERALEGLSAAVEQFQTAYADMLLAAQAMELAMARCREANDVDALRTE